MSRRTGTRGSAGAMIEEMERPAFLSFRDADARHQESVARCVVPVGPECSHSRSPAGFFLQEPVHGTSRFFAGGRWDS